MISVKNLTRNFSSGEAEVKALKGVSFDINSGELVAIIGKAEAENLPCSIFSDCLISQQTANTL